MKDNKYKTSDRILIVDDDLNILKLIRMRLEAEGFHVAAVCQPNEAVDKAEKEVFDLALLDLKLGEENGIDLTQKLHQIDVDIRPEYK